MIQRMVGDSECNKIPLLIYCPQKKGGDTVTSRVNGL